MFPIENIGKKIKLWPFHYVISLSVKQYNINHLHTYGLGNADMATIEKSMCKKGISHSFFIVSYIVSFIYLKPTIR